MMSVITYVDSFFSFVQCHWLDPPHFDEQRIRAVHVLCAVFWNLLANSKAGQIV